MKHYILQAINGNIKHTTSLNNCAKLIKEHRYHLIGKVYGNKISFNWINSKKGG